MIEEWKQVPNYEGLYDLRNDGLLYSHPRNTTKGGYRYGDDNGHGYLGTILSKDGVDTNVKMHILVWKTFVGPIPKGYVVHHKNHNRKDNRLENLELMSDYEHRKMHINERREEIQSASVEKRRKTVIQYTKEGEFVAEYPSACEAERQTGIDQGSICKVCRGKSKTSGGFIWCYKSVS